MRVLIIGGTRFIGPQVVKQLIVRGWDVTVFHRGRTPTGVREIAASRYPRRSMILGTIRQWQTRPGCR